MNSIYTRSFYTQGSAAINSIMLKFKNGHMYFKINGTFLEPYYNTAFVGWRLFVKTVDI